MVADITMMTMKSQNQDVSYEVNSLDTDRLTPDNIEQPINIVHENLLADLENLSKNSFQGQEIAQNTTQDIKFVEHNSDLCTEMPSKPTFQHKENHPPNSKPKKLSKKPKKSTLR